MKPLQRSALIQIGNEIKGLMKEATAMAAEVNPDIEKLSLLDWWHADLKSGENASCKETLIELVESIPDRETVKANRIARLERELAEARKQG